MVKDAHADVEETKLKAWALVPLLECIPSMYKAVGLIPGITHWI